MLLVVLVIRGLTTVYFHGNLPAQLTQMNKMSQFPAIITLLKMTTMMARAIIPAIAAMAYIHQGTSWDGIQPSGAIVVVVTTLALSVTP